MTALNTCSSTLHLYLKGNAALRLITPATSVANYRKSQSASYSTVDAHPVRVIKDATTASLKRGTGGRSSFNGIVCTVFGASGFYGSYVCNRLGKVGTQLIIPYRSEHFHLMRLKLAGDLGQLLYHPFDLRDEDSIKKCIKYSNVVVNLIGRDWETKNYSYDDVHVEGARRLARLCKEAGVERFIHLSCLNAGPEPEPIFIEGGSKYYKSKWEGELAVREEFPEATIVRPALTYGQDDRYLMVLGGWSFRRLMRGVVMWERGEKTIKQPIWVGDVAKGIRELVLDPNTAGKTYQFVGPTRYYLGDMNMWVTNYTRFQPELFGYHIKNMKYWPIYKLWVTFCEKCTVNSPIGMVHWEGLEIEHTTDKVDPSLPTIEDLGIKPAELADRIEWEMRPLNIENFYMDEIGEFEKPKAPIPAP